MNEALESWRRTRRMITEAQRAGEPMTPFTVALFDAIRPLRSTAKLARMLAHEDDLRAQSEARPLPKSARPLCGARTRAGGHCEARVYLRDNGELAKRCALHGGKSTGPKTAEGRDRIGESNRRRIKHKKADGLRIFEECGRK